MGFAIRCGVAAQINWSCLKDFWARWSLSSRPCNRSRLSRVGEKRAGNKCRVSGPHSPDSPYLAFKEEQNQILNLVKIAYQYFHVESGIDYLFCPRGGKDTPNDAPSPTLLT